MIRLQRTWMSLVLLRGALLGLLQENLHLILSSWPSHSIPLTSGFSMPPPRNATFKHITIATCNGIASRSLVAYISSTNYNHPRRSRDEIDMLINKTPYSAWLSTQSLARFWPANGVVVQTYPFQRLEDLHSQRPKRPRRNLQVSMATGTSPGLSLIYTLIAGSRHDTATCSRRHTVEGIRGQD